MFGAINMPIDAPCSHGHDRNAHLTKHGRNGTNASARPSVPPELASGYNSLSTNGPSRDHNIKPGTLSLTRSLTHSSVTILSQTQHFDTPEYLGWDYTAY